MPIYDYKCQNPSCGTVVEVIEPANTTITMTCVCGHAMTRTIGLSTFRLKGEGWGKDNYQGGSNAAE